MILNAIAVEMVTHKTRKQMLQSMNAFSGITSFIGHAETQVEYGNGVAMRRVHGLSNTDSRGFPYGYDRQ